MGWLSDTWSSAKDAVSDAWSGVKDEVRDITGVDSMNSLFATGGLAMVPANLSGQGMLGEAFASALSPLTAVPQGPMPIPQQGPLMQGAPSGLTMGAGGQPAAQTVMPSGQDLAGLFGDSGYQYGGPSQTSTALLQSNPEAYQYQPLMNGIS